MKLINHNKNNSYDIDTYVMRGTIEMTEPEWQKAVDYLFKVYQKAVKECDTYVRDSLSNFNEYDKNGKPKQYIDIGITATQLIVKKYGLKNYKDQNYGLKIAL